MKSLAHDFPLAEALARPTDRLSLAASGVTTLVAEIEECRRVVDASLAGPALWQGLLRRELLGRFDGEAKARYVRTFNWLRTVGPTWNRILTPRLLEVLQTGHSASGGLRRTGIAIIGRATHEFPSAAALPALIEASCVRLTSATEHPLYVAARAHLEIVTLHPYPDGNGRTARLLSSLILMRAGFKSTLFTAVERHFHHSPEKYISVLDEFRFGRSRLDESVAGLLEGLLASVQHVAWFLRREGRLKAVCQSLFDASEVESRMDSFDRGLNGADSRLITRAGPPLHAIIARLPPKGRVDFGIQLNSYLRETSSC